MSSGLVQIGQIRSSDSLWREWDRCHRATHYRYGLEIEPTHLPPWDPRNLGDVVDAALNGYHGTPVSANAIEHAHAAIRLKIPGTLLGEHGSRNATQIDLARVRGVATAMINGYHAQWREQPVFDSFEPQVWFSTTIDHPETYARAEAFTHRGKIDGVVKMRRPFVWGGVECEPGTWILENKTSSGVDPYYLAKLKTDPQILLYVSGLARERMQVISGVLYNVIEKTRIDQKAPETAEEYEARIKQMAVDAENAKLGTRLRQKKDEPESSYLERRIDKGREEVIEARAKGRSMGETDVEYSERLATWYANAEHYVRVVVRPTERHIADAMTDRFEAAQEYLRALASGTWRKNRGACYDFGRPCDYKTLCDSFDDREIMERDFRSRRKGQGR